MDKQTLKQQIKAAARQDANALLMFRKTMSQTKYKTKQLLGRGECSTTWLVESGSGKIHVLKKVDMSRREEAMKEVNILASCSHRNIVRFGGARELHGDRHARQGRGNSMEVKLAALWKADIYSAEFIRLPTQEEKTATHENRCASLDEY